MHVAVCPQEHLVGRSRRRVEDASKLPTGVEPGVLLTSSTSMAPDRRSRSVARFIVEVDTEPGDFRMLRHVAVAIADNPHPDVGRRTTHIRYPRSVCPSLFEWFNTTLMAIR